MSSARIELSKIRTLTFYADDQTVSRRKQRVPQLVCHGNACNLYQPEVVYCTSLPGGEGVDVDWKCQADLPESLRFGKVEVSCEGWSGPGDPWVLKGSCSLDYRLVQVPSSLRGSATDNPVFRSLKSFDVGALIFYTVWIGFLGFFLYQLIFKRCANAVRNAGSRTANQPGGGGGAGGRFTGNDRRDDPPPPYYPKSGENINATNNGTGWRPGFWSGLALGGIGNHLLNRRQNETVPPSTQSRRTTYDWENRQAPQSSPFNFNSGRSSSFSRRDDDDRGEGPSDLGQMRSSTGFGGSRVR